MQLTIYYVVICILPIVELKKYLIGTLKYYKLLVLNLRKHLPKEPSSLKASTIL